MKHCVVMITAKDTKEAQKIAKVLLAAKYVACVNIVGNIQSMFWWQGKIDRSQEVLLLCKTQKSLFKKIETAVKAVHSYQNPEIIALPIEASSKAYSQWIDGSLNLKKG